MPTVADIYAFHSDPDPFGRYIRQNIQPQIVRCIPFMERSKWMCMKMFLESDMTLKDMQTKLGLRRPGQVADMLTTITNKERKTGYFLDKFADVMGVTIELKADHFEDIRRDSDLLISLSEKVLNLNSEDFTEEELDLVTRVLNHSKNANWSFLSKDQLEFQRSMRELREAQSRATKME